MPWNFIFLKKKYLSWTDICSCPGMGRPWATVPSELHLLFHEAPSSKNASPVVSPVMSSSTYPPFLPMFLQTHFLICLLPSPLHLSAYSFCSLFLFVSGLWIILGKDFPFPYNFIAEITGRGGVKSEHPCTLPAYKQPKHVIASSYPNCKDFWIKSLFSMYVCVCNSAVNMSFSSGFQGICLFCKHSPVYHSILSAKINNTNLNESIS